MSFFEDHPNVIHLIILCVLFGLLLTTNYINGTVYPVTTEHKNITVGERFPYNYMIVTTDNVKYRVQSSELLWSLMPNHKYQIELSYNMSMSDQNSKQPVVTNATEIFDIGGNNG